MQSLLRIVITIVNSTILSNRHVHCLNLDASGTSPSCIVCDGILYTPIQPLAHVLSNDCRGCNTYPAYISLQYACTYPILVNHTSTTTSISIISLPPRILQLIPILLQIIQDNNVSIPHRVQCRHQIHIHLCIQCC